ncbi:MAG TPA: hypothetical protein VFW78_00200 [Bacteroidia bacterium]|nr:hypothetical protein [Bacteroidia bacterium]
MKLLSLVSLLTLVPLFTFGQKIAPTTEEEYNYGAVGYKIQLNARLPVKPGYRIIDMKGCEDDERKVEYRAVYRDGEQEPCFLIMIYTRLRVPPVYFCIPTTDADPALWKKYYNSLTAGTDNPAEQLQFFSYCLGQLTMEFAEQKK